MTAPLITHPVSPGADQPTCCPWCGQALTDRADLHRHINTTHTASTTAGEVANGSVAGTAATSPRAVGGRTLPLSPPSGGPTS